MERRKFTREFKLEAVRLIKERGVSYASRPRSQRSRSDEELGAKVRSSFLASERTYGARLHRPLVQLQTASQLVCS